jgi:hypothetical protein
MPPTLPSIPSGAVVITISVPLPQLPVLPESVAISTPTSIPGFPGGAPGSGGLSVDFPSTPPSAGITFPETKKAGICGMQLPSPVQIKFIIPLPIIKFPPKIPLPFIALKLSCDLSHPVDVTAGLKLPYGGARANNSGTDFDDYPEAG